MATQAFLDQWRQGGGALRHLLLLTAARDDGSQSDTIYLTDHEVATLANVVPGIAAGKLWASAVINFRPISCPGEFCGTSVPLCGTSVTLNADRPVVLPGAGGLLDTTLRKMLQTHVMTNATATIYRAFEGHIAAGDAQAFGPFRVIAIELEGSKLTLQLRQSTDWNKPVAPRYVTKQQYPRAPEDAVGTPLPIIYGANRPRPLRRPWTSKYPAGLHSTTGQTAESVVAGTAHGVSRAVLVDTGRLTAGQNSALKVLVAGHDCAVIGLAGDAGLHIEAGELLGPDNLTVTELFSNAMEAGFVAAPNWSYWFSAVLPATEVLAPANSAYNAAHVLARSDTQFALLDQTAGYRELQVRVASPPPDLGTPLSLFIQILYRSSAVLTALKTGIYNDAMALQGGGPYTIAASTTPTVHRQLDGTWTAWAAPFPTSPWAFGSDRILRIFFDQAASPAGWCRVFSMCLSVTFAPKQQVIQSERVREELAQRLVEQPRSGRSRWEPYVRTVREPAVTETRGKFWANVRGLKDDGSGTYTGTASALIQRAPDILRHMLVTYGGISAGDIETDASAFGSFVAARAALVDSQGRDTLYGYPITSSVDIMTMLGHMGESALAMPMISPYDGKWRLVVWRESPTVTYPWKFSRWDAVESLQPIVQHDSLPHIVTGVRVNYAYDGRLNATTQECALGFDRSSAGYLYFGLRDQYMSVIAGVNDRLDFKPSGAGVLAANLSAADYATVQAFCEHLRTQMDAAAVAASSSARFLVGQGGFIKQSYNDRLSYDRGTADFYVGLPPGAYATMKALCNGAMHSLNYASNRAGSHASGVRLVTITSAMKTHGLLVGMGIGGTGIPANTTIVSIDSETTLTVSADTMAPFTGTYGISAHRTVSFANGVAIVTMASTAGLVRGLGIDHASFAAGTIILTVDSATQITVSNNSSAPGSAVLMNFFVPDLFEAGTSGGWLLDYAPTTDSNEGKVTVSKIAGTWNILAGASATSAERATSGWASLGFSQLLGDISVPTTPTVATAHDDRFVDHIWIQSLHSVTDYLFQSGANGQDSATAVRHCGDLVGAVAHSDMLGSDSTHGSVCFLCPKGVREQALKKSATRYGARRDVALEARAIYETDAALTLRNRLTDLLGKPRTTIRFNTTKAPDIERGHVFEFWPDMDDFHYPGLGSDGKWTGKRFIVIDVTHHLGPTSRDTTIVAVDVTGPAGGAAGAGWGFGWGEHWGA